MIKITTDPLSWITGAVGNIISSILFFYLAYSLGTCAVTVYCSEGFAFSLLSLPLSLITGGGVIAIPLSIWIFWALLFDQYNKYILLSIVMLVGAFVTVPIMDGEGVHWYTIPILFIPLTILYRSWREPLSDYSDQYRKWKQGSPDHDPFRWFTSTLGFTLSSVLLVFITFELGYMSNYGSFETTDVSWCILEVPESWDSEWILLTVPVCGWILWALLFKKFSPYVLYSLNILTGAGLAHADQGWMDSTLYTLPILLAPTFIIFLAGQAKVLMGIQWIKRRKFKGINIDTPET